MNRTLAERRLAEWLLTHGTPDAAAFLPQLDRAEVTPMRCECGCGSIDFYVPGQAEAATGIRPLADYVFDDPAGHNCGIFIFEKAGFLGGIEVYGLDGDASATLPTPEALRPWP